MNVCTRFIFFLVQVRPFHILDKLESKRAIYRGFSDRIRVNTIYEEINLFLTTNFETYGQVTHFLLKEILRETKVAWNAQE